MQGIESSKQANKQSVNQSTSRAQDSEGEKNVQSQILNNKRFQWTTD